jgi:hypothetical protein
MHGAAGCVILSPVMNMDAPPRPPEQVRIIDPDGREIEPILTVYLGPDPEHAAHTFEVWFPLGAAQWARRFTIGRLPSHTALSLRFGTPLGDEG